MLTDNLYNNSNNTSTVLQSQEGTDIGELFMEPYSSIYAFTGFFIIFAGVFANTYIIYLYAARKIEQTLFNYFLLLIGVSNVFQNLGALPYLVNDIYSKNRRSSSHTNGGHIKSDFECAIEQGQSFFFLGAFVTVYTICFMAIKWYMIVRSPLGHQQDKSKRKLSIFAACLWLLACVLILPNFLTTKGLKTSGYCVRVDNFGIAVEFYKAVLFCAGFVIPVVLMLATYALIIRQFYVKSRLGGENGIESPVKVRYRKKVAIFLGIVIAVFLFCWTPFGVYFLLTMIKKSFGSDTDPNNFRKSLKVLKLVLLPCFCAAILNIICYGMKDKEIKTCFKDLFSCCSSTCCRCKKRLTGASVVYQRNRQVRLESWRNNFSTIGKFFQLKTRSPSTISV